MQAGEFSWKAYAAVLGLTACALVLTFFLRGVIDPNFFLPFTAVVLVSSWFYGLRAGLLSIVLSVITVDFFFMPPEYSLALSAWSQAATLVTFVCVAVLIAGLVNMFRDSRDALTATLASIGDGVVVTDREGRITFLNAVAEDLCGWTAKEAVGKPVNEVIRLHDEQADKTIDLPVNHVMESVVVSQPSRHMLLISRDDTRIPVEESLAPVLAGQGRTRGSILVLRNTTRRRQAQDQLSLSEKMDAVGRLAGGVAGDFNNLLTVITGYSEMLRAELPAGNPLRRFAEEIMMSAERAAGLTRQLLAFSRGSGSKPKSIDLNTILANMDAMLRRLLGGQIDLIILPGPNLGKIRADPAQLEQAVVNLALNSRDAMPHGGRFVLETSNIEIQEGEEGERAAIPPGSYVMLAVSDTGIGMEPEIRSRLFEPFFTTKEQGKGSGLGLSIVYGIIRQSEGHISVYSQKGAGTIFEIYLPRISGPVAVEPVKPKPHRGSETILVADDEDGVRKLVFAVLAQNGYQVIEARNGREALSAFEANPARIDLVLTDVVMPHMDGIELGNRLWTANPSLRVLFMSGYRDSTIGGENGGRDRVFLHKPFTPDVLLGKVREMLDAPAESA